MARTLDSPLRVRSFSMVLTKSERRHPLDERTPPAIDITGSIFSRVKDGKFVEEWRQLDMAKMMHQLGIETTGEPIEELARPDSGQWRSESTILIFDDELSSVIERACEAHTIAIPS
ncbi:MAG: hypothetical protein ACNA8W_15800 [Bradymonadaceae bacterium]